MPRTKLGVTVAAVVALTAACDFGATGPAGTVADTSAVLHGHVHTDSAETVAWWFEYGPTLAFGSATPEEQHTSTAAGAAPVSAMATGLDEDATYLYRLCVRNDRGRAACGTALEVTTTTGQDSVHGGSTHVYDPLITLSAVVSATAGADGGAAVGHASVLPGSLQPEIPAEGPVECLRVDGNRAAVGFVADYMTPYGEPDEHLVLHITDDPAGDSWWVDSWIDPTTCPDPRPLPFGRIAWPVPADAFVVHDHP